MASRLVHEEIDAPPAPAADCTESLQRLGANLRFLLGRQSARAQVLRVVAQVFGLVIVELVGWHDADGRQRSVAEDAYRVFAATHIAFGNNQRIGFGCQCIGRAQAAGRLDLADADAGTFVGRLDEQGQPQACFDRGKIAVGLHQLEIGRGNAHGTPQQLGAPFVHAQGRSHDPAAGIRNTHELECPLHGAVLAVAAMQGNEHAIELRERLQRLFCRIETVCVHAAALHGGQHGSATLERHRAFAGTTAQQHRHFAESATHSLLLR